MPRPTTKVELVSASTDKYVQLDTILDALSPSQRNALFPFDHRDRNIRDVISHLLEWQVMMLMWYETGMAGGEPDMPATGYTWKETPELNMVIWTRYQETSLTAVRRKLAVSHAALLELVSAHSDEELFTRRRYSWTGTTSLASYFTSAMSSHYDWAIRLVRRFTRTLGSNTSDAKAVKRSTQSRGN